MKGAKRTWILGMILIVLGVYFVQAITIPGADLMRGVAENMRISQFRYMFFAIGLVTFYYLYKNKILIEKIWIAIALSAVAGYGISAWRLTTDGWEAYLYITLACLTLRARKSSGERDKAAGIDAGLMYMVAAGVLAPFNSLAAGAEIGNAFLTHFVIGVGFPVIIAPMKEKFFGRRDEQGQGLYGEWKKKREGEKAKEKGEADMLEQREKEVEYHKKTEEEKDSKIKELEVKIEEVRKNPNPEMRQQHAQQAMEQIHPFSAAHPMYMMTAMSSEIARMVYERMRKDREDKSRLEDGNRFLQTPKGRSAKFMDTVEKSVEKKGTKAVVELFGENWNDDSKFSQLFVKYCRDEEAYKDLKKRLNRVKGKNGVITPKNLTRLSKELKKDYMRDREHSINVLKEALKEEAEKGHELTSDARHYEEGVNGFNQAVRNDEVIAERANSYVDAIRKNLEKLKNPSLAIEQSNVLIQQIKEFYKKLREELARKIQNEEVATDRVKDVEKRWDEREKSEDGFDMAAHNVSTEQSRYDSGEDISEMLEEITRKTLGKKEVKV